jgi:hypothetical protein
MAEEIVTYNRLAPYIEERGKQLLTSTFGDPNAVRQPNETEADFQARKLGRAGVPQPIAGFQVAGLDPSQQQALSMAQQGIGQYQPFLDQAGQSIGEGIQATRGAARMFAPTAEGIQAYMDPYQQAVTQDALAELDRQAQLQQQGVDAQAVGAGAFGTERSGIQNAEMARNLQDIKSRRIFEDLSRNFQQAQQTAQQSFEVTARQTVQCWSAISSPWWPTSWTGTITARIVWSRCCTIATSRSFISTTKTKCI